MNDISQKLKETLLGLIRNQDLSECVRAPDKDFARNRKLPYEKMILSLLTMEGTSLKNETVWISLRHSIILCICSAT